MKLFEVVSLFTYGFSKLIPKKKNRWIFGAWFGNAFSDNTKALYDYVEANHPEIERVWISSDPAKADLPGCKVVKRNSFSSLKYILTANVAVMNQGFGDFAAFSFLGGAYKVQLWHGVAWKKIGRDAVPHLHGFYEKIYQLINHYDLYIAPSRKYGETLKTAFKTDDSHILYVGQPRNEVLFSKVFKNESRIKIEKKTGISNKRIIAYMPTFRDKTSEVFSFHKIGTDARFLEAAEKHDFIVVEKLHYKNGQRAEIADEKNRVYSFPDVDAATLLGAADLLITDYSSCFFDYLITDKPVIHFAYDYEYYKNKDRGLYYDISEVAAGTVVNNEEELIAAIDDNLRNDPGKKQRARVREQFITFESDHNCERVFKTIEEHLSMTNEQHGKKRRKK